jgi:hypothetical protein
MKSRLKLIGRKFLCLGLAFILVIFIPHTRLSDTSVVHAQGEDVSTTVSEMLYDSGRGENYYHVDFLTFDGYGFGLNIFVHDYGDGQGQIATDFSLTSTVLPPSFFFASPAECQSDITCAQCIEQDRANCIDIAINKAIADSLTILIPCLVCIASAVIPLAIACAVICAVATGFRMRQIRAEAENCMAGSASRCSAQLGRPCR